MPRGRLSWLVSNLAQVKHSRIVSYFMVSLVLLTTSRRHSKNHRKYKTLKLTVNRDVMLIYSISYFTDADMQNITDTLGHQQDDMIFR